jgi:hypothetical protein
VGVNLATHIEDLGTLRKAPKGASQGAQTATSRAWWRFWGKIQPAGYSYTALRHASIQRHSEAHGMGPMARGGCVILAR